VPDNESRQTRGSRTSRPFMGKRIEQADLPDASQEGPCSSGYSTVSISQRPRFPAPLLPRPWRPPPRSGRFAGRLAG